MSRVAVSLTVGSSAFGQERFDAVGGIADPLNASTTAADLATLLTDRTAFEATLATLVADAGSPTQAHVTSANSAYTTMQTALAAVVADIAAVPAAADVVLSINTTNVAARGLLDKAVTRLVRLCGGNKVFV